MPDPISDPISDPIDSNTAEDDVAKWCFAWDPTDVPGSGVGRMALELKNKWPKGSVVNVAFLDGVKSVQDKIKKVVKEWTGPGMANLTIVFVKDPNISDVRITFKFPGSWSVIGTSCQNLSKTTASMNFGWLTPKSTAEEVRRVTLHEFGHALSLIHEHQNPVGSIPWNKDAVIKDLSGPPNNWDAAKIQHNMFEIYAKDAVDATDVDPLSIMMYPIPKTWVTDPKFVAGTNTELSPTDKQKIHLLYP
jgi:serralysin